MFQLKPIEIFDWLINTLQSRIENLNLDSLCDTSAVTLINNYPLQENQTRKKIGDFLWRTDGDREQHINGVSWLNNTSAAREMMVKIWKKYEPIASISVTKRTKNEKKELVLIVSCACACM